MNKVDIYKRNTKIAKIIGVLTPIVFWLCIALSVICLCYAIKNSLGNINEITDMLDSNKYTNEQIRENYNYLVNKYGEWVVGSGNSGFTLVFVNIKNAVFGGFAIFNGIMSVVFLVSAFLFGKWIMPYIKNKITRDNQDMVNMEILKKE